MEGEVEEEEEEEVAAGEEEEEQWAHSRSSCDGLSTYWARSCDTVAPQARCTPAHPTPPPLQLKELAKCLNMLSPSSRAAASSTDPSQHSTAMGRHSWGVRRACMAR